MKYKNPLLGTIFAAALALGLSSIARAETIDPALASSAGAVVDEIMQNFTAQTVEVSMGVSDMRPSLVEATSPDKTPTNLLPQQNNR